MSFRVGSAFQLTVLISAASALFVDGLRLSRKMGPPPAYDNVYKNLGLYRGGSADDELDLGTPSIFNDGIWVHHEHDDFKKMVVEDVAGTGGKALPHDAAVGEVPQSRLYPPVPDFSVEHEKFYAGENNVVLGGRGPVDAVLDLDTWTVPAVATVESGGEQTHTQGPSRIRSGFLRSHVPGPSSLVKTFSTAVGGASAGLRTVSQIPGAVPYYLGDGFVNELNNDRINLGRVSPAELAIVTLTGKLGKLDPWRRGGYY